VPFEPATFNLQPATYLRLSQLQVGLDVANSRDQAQHLRIADTFTANNPFAAGHEVAQTPLVYAGGPTGDFFCETWAIDSSTQPCIAAKPPAKFRIDVLHGKPASSGESGYCRHGRHELQVGGAPLGLERKRPGESAAAGINQKQSYQNCLSHDPRDGRALEVTEQTAASKKTGPSIPVVIFVESNLPRRRFVKDVESKNEVVILLYPVVCDDMRLGNEDDAPATYLRVRDQCSQIIPDVKGR
jgi:hypothetical protein